MGRYEKQKHDEHISCPRSNCGVRNAPKNSNEFDYKCWKCGARLPVDSEVSVGEILEVDVFDLHESGSGVGRTKSGFIILVDGALPEARYRVEVTETKDSYANAEAVEKTADEITSKDEDENEDEGSLGRRDNFWG